MWPCSTSRRIGVPWETSTPKTIRAGVGMGVEVDQADRAVAGGAGADVGLGDRSGRRRGRSGSPRRRGPRRRSARSPRGCAPGRPAAPARRRSRRRAAPRSASTPASRWGPGRAACGADRARAEAGPGAIGDEVVHRCADDRDVDALELGRVLGVGDAGEGQQARRSRASHRAPASGRGGRSRACNSTPTAQTLGPPTRVVLGSAPLPMSKSNGGRPCAQTPRRWPLPWRRSSPSAPPPPPAAGNLAPQGKKVFFGISDTGDPADFGELQQADPQAPGADRDLPHLGHRLPGLDRTLAGRAGAAGDAHLDRRQARRPRADHAPRRSPAAKATST